ncbi:MAG TPA: WG repeat-containing protein [Sulfurovum sp.]|nr:WG repeat-containing protein [Sulfurovum sp.]
MKYLLLILTLFIFISCSKSNPIPQDSSIKSYRIDDSYLKRLDFKGQELISIFQNNTFYYVRKDGKAIQTLTYENKADPFSDGLARTKVNGKIGFFNTNLDIILKPIYDFAFPFYKGKAEICTGCKEKNIGKHSMLEGGKWQKIDRSGLVIE